MAKVVIHRDFPGGYAHGDETCWCQPIVTDALDDSPAPEVLERADDEGETDSSRYAPSNQPMH